MGVSRGEIGRRICTENGHTAALLSRAFTFTTPRTPSRWSTAGWLVLSARGNWTRPFCEAMESSDLSIRN
jgi:hypothetical protein